MRDLKSSKYAQKAMEIFSQGYNCSQAVVLAFEDKFPEDIDREMIKKLSSSFGGGVGGLREVCGAVNGMAIVLGILKGYNDPKDIESKKEHYKRVQYAADEFAKENGGIICRELLGLKPGERPVTKPRNTEYYKKRPCPEMVGMAGAILEEML